MTFAEYNKMMEDFRSIEEKRESFLSEKLKEFIAKDPDNKARKIAGSIFENAIYWSTNGSSNRCVDTEELANKVHDILVDELMDYMLDEPEVYEDYYGDGGTSNCWAISALFGGNYCLNWEE